VQINKESSRIDEWRKWDKKKEGALLFIYILCFWSTRGATCL